MGRSRTYLEDKRVIYKLFKEGKFIEHKYNEFDLTMLMLETFINKGLERTFKLEYQYQSDKHKCINITNRSIENIINGVNQLRLKFWYFKKLKSCKK